MQTPAIEAGDDGKTASSAATVGRTTLIIKNAFALFVVLGFVLALETGYFSNDRTSRAEWDEMERLKTSTKGTPIYEARFEPDTLGGRKEAQGFWRFYNGAGSDTASIENGRLEVTYTEPWIGAEFRHTAFETLRVYRVHLELAVEGQPGAILVRNRMHDLLREQLPVTSGEFKPMSFVYVTPGGRLDMVRIALIPDRESDVKGRLTIRKFRIERLGS
jgi:hypothetical protein